ncbi:MAG: NAD(P)/FAD-dependent oxidoreductase [Enterobacteriaceae bacterium]
MNRGRRDFLLKTAILSGAGALASLLPPSLLAQERALATVARPRLLADAINTPSRLAIDPTIWNWHKGMPAEPMPANYYEASLASWASFEPLQEDESCDVVVIGGGLLGVSTALHLSKAGMDVRLVEKDNIGSGASGRNGGQTTPGIARWEAENMLEALSEDEARRLWRFSSFEAMDLLDELAADYGFSCDRSRGHITAANHAGHMGALVSSADARRLLGDASVNIIGPYELEERYIHSNIYHGAAIDSLGGQLHPLALLRGLAYGLVQQGGRIYEKTRVTEIRPEAGATRVITAQGSIKARKVVVLAVHSATFNFLSEPSTTIPFYTYVSVSAPLEVDAHKLIPCGYPVYDTQLQIDYYRVVRNNRLLFGGQGTGNSWSARDVNNYLLDRIKTVFPQLGNPQLDYSWGGITDMTLSGVTDARKSDDSVPLYLVHGWSGHGVAQTVRIGKAISDDLIGTNHDFAMLTRFKHMEIPLGHYLSPVVIPMAKGALTVHGLLNPADMISF